MRLLRAFGIGTTNAIAGEQAVGIVTDVKTFYWIKVNTKAVRSSASDGAVYPHIIHFTYRVGRQEYTGKRYIQWNKRCPLKGEKLTVYYETDNPAKSAVIV